MRIAVVGNGRSVHATGRAAAVAARGHAVRFVTAGPVLPAPGVEVRTREVPASLAAAGPAARGFLRDVREFAPDLLHLHYAGGKLGTLATLTRVRPLVVTVMGGDVLPEQHAGGLPALERRATRRVLSLADLVLVKSDALRPAVAALRDGPPPRMETLRWGVDPAVFRRDERGAAAWRTRLGLAPSDRAVLSPRAVAPLYNTHILVEAFAAVVATTPEAVLVLTEYNAEAAYLRRLRDDVARLGLGGRVRFAGAVPHADMPALYTLAEMAVGIPSSDGLPQSIFEAMACGCPLVAGRLPAYDEVLADGETARLTDIDPTAVGAAITGLLADRPAREAIAASALARVREVAWLPRELERLDALYAELARQPRPRTPRAPLALDALSLAFR